MAVTDILGQSGDAQDFIVEIPTGNASYVPNDALLETGLEGAVSEIPAVVGGGGSNIFIMSE